MAEARQITDIDDIDWIPDYIKKVPGYAELMPLPSFLGFDCFNGGRIWHGRQRRLLLGGRRGLHRSSARVSA